MERDHEEKALGRVEAWDLAANGEKVAAVDPEPRLKGAVKDVAKEAVKDAGKDAAKDAAGDRDAASGNSR